MAAVRYLKVGISACYDSHALLHAHFIINFQDPHVSTQKAAICTYCHTLVAAAQVTNNFFQQQQTRASARLASLCLLAASRAQTAPPDQLDRKPLFRYIVASVLYGLRFLPKLHADCTNKTTSICYIITILTNPPYPTQQARCGRLHQLPAALQRPAPAQVK